MKKISEYSSYNEEFCSCECDIISNLMFEEIENMTFIIYTVQSIIAMCGVIHEIPLVVQ